MPNLKFSSEFLRILFDYSHYLYFILCLFLSLYISIATYINIYANYYYFPSFFFIPRKEDLENNRNRKIFTNRGSVKIFSLRILSLGSFFLLAFNLTFLFSKLFNMVSPTATPEFGYYCNRDMKVSLNDIKSLKASLDCPNNDVKLQEIIQGGLSFRTASIFTSFICFFAHWSRIQLLEEILRKQKRVRNLENRKERRNNDSTVLFNSMVLLRPFILIGVFALGLQIIYWEQHMAKSSWWGQIRGAVLGTGLSISLNITMRVHYKIDHDIKYVST